MPETTRRVRPDGLAFDVDVAIEGVGAFLRTRLEEAGLACSLPGLSGGVDSACAAGLAARAVGAERLLTIKDAVRHLGGGRRRGCRGRRGGARHRTAGGRLGRV